MYSFQSNPPIFSNVNGIAKLFAKNQIRGERYSWANIERWLRTRKVSSQGHFLPTSVGAKGIFCPREIASGNQPAAAADGSSGGWVCVGPWIYRWRGPRGSAWRVKLPWTRSPRSWCHPPSPCRNPRLGPRRSFRPGCPGTFRPRSSERTRTRRSDDVSHRRWWRL